MYIGYCNRSITIKQTTFTDKQRQAQHPYSDTKKIDKQEKICVYSTWGSLVKEFLQGCHLSSTLKFPDFSLTFCSFPYPLTDKKNHFYFLV